MRTTLQTALLPVVLVALCPILARSAGAAAPVAIFHVGNSLTDQAYGMHDMAKARKHETKFGRHMIPGAPLDWLWNHRNEGFREPGTKAADEILQENKWDVLILQPFGHAPEDEAAAGANYAAAAYKGNPACQVYVFANYPEIGKDREKADEWEKRWLSPTDRKGRANFEKVAALIAAKSPGKKPVRIIPVGEVMYRLHLRMKDGKVPGFKHIAGLYEDGVHLNSAGKYLEAATHYATVFQDDPHGTIISGLRFWKAPYSVEKQFAEVVWDVVWEVVTSYPQFTWRQTETSLALLNRGRMVWEHVHDRKIGKPYMRIALLDGTELTRPWPFAKDYPKNDHTWHRALWWSWKAINGINFWEENQEGTDPTKVDVSHREDGSARIEAAIAYHLPERPPLVLEKRVIEIGKPDALGNYLIDWKATFTPAGKDDVIFNRNGYGGFAIRLAAEFCGNPAQGKPAWQFIKSVDGKDAPPRTSRWMAYHGTAQNGQPAAVAIFDHPANPRYPSLWQTRAQYPYLNPSFTCDADYTLRAGRSITLRYGVLAWHGPLDVEELERAWQAFAAAKP